MALLKFIKSSVLGMKDLKKVSDQKFDALVGTIWSMIDESLKTDEIKAQLS